MNLNFAPVVLTALIFWLIASVTIVLRLDVGSWQWFLGLAAITFQLGLLAADIRQRVRSKRQQ